MHSQPPFPPSGSLSTGHYEFTDEENRTIADVGSRARLWGLISLITGVLALVGLIVSLLFKEELIDHGLDANYVTVFVVGLVPVVLTHLVISMLYIGAGKSLQQVVHTQGNDVEHLMQSLDKLGTAFLIEFAIGMLAVIASFGIGIQMTVDNLAEEKAAELARAEAEASAIEAAGAADEDEDAGEDETGGADEDEDAAADEEDGDTDSPSEVAADTDDTVEAVDVDDTPAADASGGAEAEPVVEGEGAAESAAPDANPEEPAVAG